MDVKILSVDSDNEISLSSTSSFKITTGINAVIQQIVKVLLTTPGTDVWNRGMGGNIQSIVAKAASEDNIAVIQGEIAISVMNTERYLIDEQIGVDLDADSRLSSMKLKTVYFDRELSKWNVIIDVETESGKSELISIT